MKNWRLNNLDKARESSRRKYRKYKEQYLLRSKKSHYKVKYGLTLEEYNRMCSDRNYQCDLCNEKEIKKLQVDHCHKTGRVRGLLCQSCNLALGNYEKLLPNMEKVNKYLSVPA